MNKKFITLCVSALLAGGMVTPAFAQMTNLNEVTGEVAVSRTNMADYKSDQYYVLKVTGGSSLSYADGSLELTRVNGNLELDLNKLAVTQYNLWKVTPVTVNGVPTGNFTLQNMAGFKLGVNDDKKLAVNGKYQEFKFNGLGNLAVAQKGWFLGGDSNGKPIFLNTSTGAWITQFYTPTVDELSESELNDKFLSSFTIGVGYIDGDKGWKDYAVEHNLQGNVFTGDLKASTDYNLGSKGSYIFKQTLSDPDDADGKEVYLWSGDKIVVLTNNKWSKLNNSLNTETGYKFTLMTPTELANQEVADAKLIADGKTPVIRSYVYKVTAPNVVSDGALEFAAKVYNYTNYTNWEELYVSEVDGNYYLTTALAANEQTETDKLYLKQADYTANQVYVRFTENNYVDAERFFSYAWNIVRLNDNKTISPKGNAWVDKETVGPTVPEGQWILVENENADGYEWVNRETTINQDLQTPSTGFSLNALRETNANDVYSGDNIYRIGEGEDATYYSITKAKNDAGVDINLDAADRFDYFGYDTKETTTGIDQTYKVQFTNKVTGEPAYIGMNGVGDLLLTSDPTKAVQFHVNKVKTTDNSVVVTAADRNANVDVFNIYNTYVGKNDKGEWDYNKTDTVSFYRYHISYGDKYLNYNAAKANFELVDAEYIADPDFAEVTLLDPTSVDAYVIKEKGGDLINILNVDNADFDKYLENVSNVYNAVVVKNQDQTVAYVAGEKVLGAESVTSTTNAFAPTEMMYFDFNFGKARQQINIYNWVSNAQLTLDDENSNIYRNVAPTAPDTMAIYRTEYQDEFLFEKNGFLGMTVDDRGYNAALFIDTAYVRNNTEKPLFMIGLRPEITPETVFCPIHGVNAGCAHEHLDTIPGYVDADYLTVLADSSAFHAAELDNKFLANKAYTKLSFVAARHNVDTITVAADGNKTTISQNVQHPMVFAFRIVDQTTKDFIIEGVDLTNNKAPLSAGNPYKTSWMRWNNGVPVMTDIMEDAEVFNIVGDLENANPTANEAIEAEATVSVVATDGAVIVKGAEGKNVIVSTILGKVVANETVNSDNETIAAPAGIVVVSVDGESFKVAVK